MRQKLVLANVAVATFWMIGNHQDVVSLLFHLLMHLAIIEVLPKAKAS